MAETPREPDHYETATDALERIARAFDANPTAQHSGAAVASILRYLAHEAPSPAAAPAADGPCCNRATVVGNRVMHCPDHPRAPAAECPEPPPGWETITTGPTAGCGNIATYREPAAPARDLRDVEHIDNLLAEFADDPKAALACIGEYVGLRLHNRKLAARTSPPGAGEGT